MSERVSTQDGAPGCPQGELAVAWALHALEPAEEIQVAAHLPDCAECTRVVAETEQVGAVLGLAVPDARPSDDLADRVLAIPEREPQRPPPPEPASAEPTSAEPAQPPDPAAAPPSIPAPAGEPRHLPPAAATPAGFSAGASPGPPRRRPAGARGRWDPACLTEPALILMVVIMVCVMAFAVVWAMV